MATATASSSPLRLDVRLCGSVPRREMESLSLAKCAPLVLRSSHELNTNSYLAAVNGQPQRQSSTVHTIEEDKTCVAMQLCSHLNNMQHQQQTQSSSSPNLRRPSPVFEAPTWAVPAQGEARLEPVCDSADRQAHVDLTDRSVYRIGRSPQSDVQLLHVTSSRRHAMLFHHSNGSCYIVDCGSAHGTYVNGLRISSPPNGGVVVPHRVRRGSLIRFGGQGAPTFVLKSFSFDLEEMKEPVHYHTTLSPSSSVSAVVQRNTRINSLGKTAKESLSMSLSSKRSFDSIETAECEDYEPKRCSSPPLSPEHPVRLVSPDNLGQPVKRRRVTFCEKPMICYPNLISPDLSCESDCESL